jgi:hypothetical protein
MPLHSFALLRIAPSHGHCHTAHQLRYLWLKGWAVDCMFTYTLEDAFHLFLFLPPSIGLVLQPVLSGLHSKATVHG